MIDVIEIDIDINPCSENGGGETDFSKVTATPQDVFLGKKFYDNSGKLVEGEVGPDYVGPAVERKSAEVYEVSSVDRVIEANTYLIGPQTIKGILLDRKIVEPKEYQQTVTSDEDGLSEVIVDRIPEYYVNTDDPNNVYMGGFE